MSSTKRVARNTVVMYARMLVLMAISFYASRLLLSTLGVEDFGVYSLVGSIASSMAALKGLFSESIQRFLNNAKGNESVSEQKKIFNLGISIHIILAVLFVVVVEIVGIWLINNKLAIPIAKLSTAYFVFHMTVIYAAINILCVPYEAVIIANEKMGTYAFLSIFDASFRLLVTILLPVLPFIMLRTYALSIVMVPLVSLSFYFIYCRRFPECSYSTYFDKTLFKKLFSFSSWNFLGNIAFSLLHEGINLLLNIFGGLVYNAARTVAYQVKNVASQLTTNTIISVRPIIMQKAAYVENEKLFDDINTISRLSFFSIIIPTVPILAYCFQLLDIWLVDVPTSAVIFTRLVLISVIVRSLHEPLNMMYMAIGKIKRMMLIESCVMLSFFVIIYLLLKNGFPVWSSFALLILMEIAIIFSLVINAKNELGFKPKAYFKHVIMPISEISLILFVIMIDYSFFSSKSVLLCCIRCYFMFFLYCFGLFVF